MHLFNEMSVYICNSFLKMGQTRPIERTKIFSEVCLCFWKGGSKLPAGGRAKVIVKAGGRFAFEI